MPPLPLQLLKSPLPQRLLLLLLQRHLATPAKASTRNRKKSEKPAEGSTANVDDKSGDNAQTAGSSTDVSDVSFDKQIDAQLEIKKQQLKTLKDEMKGLRDMKVAWNREKRQLKTSSKKRREAKSGGNANRSPSGFAQPTRVKDALCDFLGIDRGSMVARTDVTKQVIQHITDKNLKEPGNGRNIIPDEALERLVGGPEERMKTMVERKAFLKDMSERFPNKEEWREKYEKCVETDQLTYFNLQVHLSKHFEKNEKKRAAEAAETPVVSASA